MASPPALAGAGSRNEADWERWRAEIWAPPVQTPGLRRRLLSLTPAIRALLDPSRAIEREWAPLQLHVRQVRMSAHGSATEQGGRRIVFVNAADSPELQRFTVAHELAHLLLRAPGRGDELLGPAEEEALCERFAGELLVPRELVALELAGAVPTPEAILTLCGRLRVNVRPVLRAFAERLHGGHHHLLLARWRGHPHRPADEAFRVEAAGGAAHVFMPRSQRLVSIGLGSLAERALGASHGEVFDGADERVTIQLRGMGGEHPSAEVTVPVSWRASRQGHRDPYVLAVLDVRRALQDTGVS